MRAWLLALSVVTLAAQVRDEQKLIARGQSVLISQLDPALPRERFDRWFGKLVGPKSKVSWEVNDCGEQTGNPAVDAGRDFPACAEAGAELGDGRKVFVMIGVGTLRKGVTGSPVIWSVVIERAGRFQHVGRLRDLPAAVRSGAGP